MNRLQNAQRQLAESLAALESAVEQAQSPTAHAATGNGDGNAHAGSSNQQAHLTPAIDIVQLSQELAAIEADLEKAIKMIADISASGLSSG